jgi:hypothetical protein
MEPCALSGRLLEPLPFLLGSPLLLVPEALRFVYVLHLAGCGFLRWGRFHVDLVSSICFRGIVAIFTVDRRVQLNSVPMVNVVLVQIHAIFLF